MNTRKRYHIKIEIAIMHEDDDKGAVETAQKLVDIFGNARITGVEKQTPGSLLTEEIDFNNL